MIVTNIFCFQAKLHFSRWNGPWQNHSIHNIPVWNPADWYKGPFPDHSSTFHHNKLGEGIPHLDWPECCGVPREHDQQADDSAVWDVLQGLPGIVMSLVCNNSPKTWPRWQQWQGFLTLSGCLSWWKSLHVPGCYKWASSTNAYWVNLVAVFAARCVLFHGAE